MNEIDLKIFKAFKMRRDDNLPFYAARGGRNDLIRLFNDLGYRKGAEIGVGSGNFSRFIYDTMPSVKLYSVDPWKGYFFHKQEFMTQKYFKAIEKIGNLERINVIKKRSFDAAKEFRNASLDFVYIDGDHQFNAVMLDILLWVPKVRKLGIVAGHDYYRFYKSGVVDAVDAYTRCNNIQPWYTTRDNHPTWFWVKT